MQKSNYLKTALEAATRAQEIIMRYQRGDITADLKGDNTPVTMADKEAEAIIVDTIEKAFPDHGFLAEETGASSNKSEFTWVIDPIDGTKNFLRKVPLFTTQIALMKGNEVIVGVSNCPGMGELMYAQKGDGAYLNDEKVKVSAMSDLSLSYVSYGNLTYFKDEQLQGLLRIIKDTQGHRGFGDAWPYHLLAQGKIDIVAESYVRAWDIMACNLIVTEAGGKVTELSGNSLTLTSMDILATNNTLHKTALKYFTK